MGVPDVTVQSAMVELEAEVPVVRMAVEVVKTAHAVVVDIAGTSIVEVEVQGDITAEAGVSFMVAVVACHCLYNK